MGHPRCCQELCATLNCLHQPVGHPPFSAAQWCKRNPIAFRQNVVAHSAAVPLASSLHQMNQKLCESNEQLCEADEQSER